MSDRDVLLKIYRRYKYDESILFLKNEISVRDTEIGILKSEVEEMKHEISTLKKIKEQDGLKPVRVWSQDEIVKKYTKRLESMGMEISKLKKDKIEWLNKYMSLKNKQS